MIYPIALVLRHPKIRDFFKAAPPLVVAVVVFVHLSHGLVKECTFKDWSLIESIQFCRNSRCFALQDTGISGSAKICSHFL